MGLEVLSRTGVVGRSRSGLLGDLLLTTGAGALGGGSLALAVLDATEVVVDAENASLDIGNTTNLLARLAAEEGALEPLVELNTDEEEDGGNENDAPL